MDNFFENREKCKNQFYFYLNIVFMPVYKQFPIFFSFLIKFEVPLTTPDILKGIVLLGFVAHVMLYFDGYWHEVFYLTAILTVAIPALIYKYLPNSKKRKQQKRLSQDI